MKSIISKSNMASKYHGVSKKMAASAEAWRNSNGVIGENNGSS